MRLINTQTLVLEEYYGSKIPPYAILSHTWGDEEVTFQDWSKTQLRETNAGYRKINLACQYALAHGHKHLWVDTNCIDKSSSAELSEAINSMFSWYAEASICYAYLEDVPNVSFSQSRWFSRGWTLQELLAPDELVFFDRHWKEIGRKKDRARELYQITGIDVSYLGKPQHLDRACVAEKMSWVSQRLTTRAEDMAYCMLGILDINMPLLYGEGPKAFIRLQEEIIRSSNDQSIFCWTRNSAASISWKSVLAPHPSAFSNFQSVRVRQQASIEYNPNGKVTSYALSNAGLHIRLPVLSTWSYCFMLLDVWKGWPLDKFRYCVALKGSVSRGSVARMSWPRKPLVLGLGAWMPPERDLYIQTKSPRSRAGQRVSSDPREGQILRRSMSLTSGHAGRSRISLLLAFRDVDIFKRVETYPPGLFDQSTSMFRLDTKTDILGGFVRLVKFRADDEIILFLARWNGGQSADGEVVSWFCEVMSTGWDFETVDWKRVLHTHHEEFVGKKGHVMESSKGKTAVYLWPIYQPEWGPEHLRLALIDSYDQ